LKNPPAGETVRKVGLQDGVTWPWTTDDERIADMGVIGNPQGASKELGQRVVDHVVEMAGSSLKELLNNQRFARPIE
jgi:creatinine amidohydrolase/Fe(II)-dependent formamide hydrolase-like protein